MIGRLIPALLLLFAGCADGAENAPLGVDAIAGSETAEQLIARNTRQGLVALDDEGEVAPALAQRWTVLEDGSFIFRLGDHRWADGGALTAGQIARELREARRGPGPIAPLLADIDEISAVTPRIIELTFSRRRPDLLRLLALPELGLARGGEGLGPLAIAEGYDYGDQRLLLVRRQAPPDPDGEEEEELDRPPGPGETIELRFARPALAVARFRRGETGLVLGGDWTTLPYAQAIDPQGALVIDPAEGLFGLAFVEESGFLADPEHRQLLSLAIDRGLIAAALARPEAEARTAILPADAVGLVAPVAPPWQQASLEARRRFARQAIARWEGANGEIAPLRIALPDAAGSRLLFAIVEAGWRAVGVETVRVGFEADADLRLIDRIAPSDHGEWYLQFFRCAAPFPCSTAYDEALEALTAAETPRVRAIRASEAARELESMAPFIPLVRPIRWSLVGPGIGGFAANRYAAHPLSPILAARE